ncbi:MAG: tRNA preQ1(34) S-adenosylmethionine ribosyltransferase-isomerase QueA [Pseudomonadota bacterium]
MRVDAFDFVLPAGAVAQHPASPRESARLLRVGARLADHRVADLPRLLDDTDLLVVNDTKVVPARLHGRRGSVAIELLLHEPQDDGRWRAFARPAKRLKAGDEVVVGDGLSAQILANLGGGEVELTLASDRPWLEALETHGVMPLPPYIDRPRIGDPADRLDYQTVFAAKPGAVAAPTASLHLTEALVAALHERGVGVIRLTLHVGAGTFLPIKVDDTGQHHMHSERYEMGEAAAERLNAHRRQGGRIVAAGTTTLRTLETCLASDGCFRAGQGRTDLFLQPGVAIRSIDRLLTNFHLPRSTLFMLVAAVSGLDRMRRAYQHAARSGYRFFSYGDACLLERTMW